MLRGVQSPHEPRSLEGLRVSLLAAEPNGGVGVGSHRDAMSSALGPPALDGRGKRLDEVVAGYLGRFQSNEDCRIPQMQSLHSPRESHRKPLITALSSCAGLPRLGKLFHHRTCRTMVMLDGGDLLTDVAKEVGYTAHGLTLALEKWAKDNGGETIDFRSRRGNAKAGSSANGKPSPPDSHAA